MSATAKVHVGEGGRRYLRASGELLNLAVTRLARRAIHLDHSSLKLDDPVLGDAGLRVERRLHLSVEADRAVRHLDSQEDVLRPWMGAAVGVGSRPKEQEVRLRLGDIAQDGRVLNGDQSPVAQDLPESEAAAVVQFITGDLLIRPNRVGKQLLELLEGIWSARRGSYRVLYEMDEDSRTVTVLDVDHRAAIYRPRKRRRRS